MNDPPKTLEEVIHDYLLSEIEDVKHLKEQLKGTKATAKSFEERVKTGTIASNIDYLVNKFNK